MGTGHLDLHLESFHKEEEDVKKLLKYKKEKNKKIVTDEEKAEDKARKAARTEILQVIRDEGNYLHNCKVLEKGEGTLIPGRRNSEETQKDDLLMCPVCKRTLSRHQMAFHMKKKHQLAPGRNIQTKLAAMQP